MTADIRQVTQIELAWVDQLELEPQVRACAFNRSNKHLLKQYLRKHK